MIDPRAASPVAAMLLLGAAACSRPPPPPPPPPLAPEVEREMYAAVLERVLVSGIVEMGEPVAAICLGFGEEATPPPVDLLFRFMGGQPPLYGSGSCNRSIDPLTSLPVVSTLDGAPGLFLRMMNAPLGSGRVVSMLFEHSGRRPITMRCRVDIRRGAMPLDSSAVAPRDVVGDRRTVEFRLRGC